MNNSGYMGGVIFLYGDRQGKSNFSIENSFFIRNIAYLGGALGMATNNLFMNGFINNCTFLYNFGSRKINIIEFKF